MKKWWRDTETSPSQLWYDFGMKQTTLARLQYLLISMLKKNLNYNEVVRSLWRVIILVNSLQQEMWKCSERNVKGRVVGDSNTLFIQCLVEKSTGIKNESWRSMPIEHVDILTYTSRWISCENRVFSTSFRSSSTPLSSWLQTTLIQDLTKTTTSDNG